MGIVMRATNRLHLHIIEQQSISNTLRQVQSMCPWENQRLCWKRRERWRQWRKWDRVVGSCGSGREVIINGCFSLNGNGRNHGSSLSGLSITMRPVCSSCLRLIMMMVIITRGAADTEFRNFLKGVLGVDSWYICLYMSLLFLFLLIDLELVVWVAAVIVLYTLKYYLSFSEINPQKKHNWSKALRPHESLQ